MKLASPLLILDVAIAVFICAVMFAKVVWYGEAEESEKMLRVVISDFTGK